MITFSMVNNILKTLPIGYYLGRKIDCELADSDATFYNPNTQKVQIGYRMLPCLELTGTEDEIENDVRCALYHEISHVILTPKTTVTKLFNVFEDERIETMLKDFYHRVDFKSFVKKVNGYMGEPPMSADDMFYQVVRYRVGEKRFTDRVKEIIHQYRTINASTNPNHVDIYNYKYDIEMLYWEIKEYFKEHKPEPPTPPTPPTPPEPLTPPEKMKKKKGSGKGKKVTEEPETEEPEDNEDEEPEDGESEDDEDGEDGDGNGESEEPEKEWTPEEIKQIKNAIKQAFKGVFERYNNKELTLNINRIIDRATRKKNMTGGAVNGYAGKLNPRQVGNGGKPDLYKWFEKPINTNGNRYSKVRLNLFVDVSGSFQGSENVLNQLITSVNEVEKNNRDLSVNVIKMGNTNRIAPKNERLVKCEEGNYLTNDIIGIYNQVQETQAMNYNVIVFDGNAQSFDGMWGTKKEIAIAENEKAWTAFNHPNCTIISDYSNKDKMELHCTNAKRIYTYNYAEEFIENVLKAMEQMFR